MPFPFLNQPFPGWIKDKLNYRNTENGKIELNQLTPFVFLTSGNAVGNYFGCRLTNYWEVEMRYQPKESMIGYDLSGKPIKTIGESNRMVSAPVVTGLSIDTDGGNNTLKEAKVSVVIFTQKQLDMFELFFMRPGVNLILEFGHNNPKTKSIIESTMITKGIKDSLGFANTILKYRPVDRNQYNTAKNDYISKISTCQGDYDFWCGVLTNFDLSYESDSNTYKVDLTISSGNELQLWSTVNQNLRQTTDLNEKSADIETPVTAEFKSWVKKLITDTKLSTKYNKFAVENDYKKEFFNWGAVNKNNQSLNASKNQYISFKLALDLANETEVWKTTEEKIDTKLFQYDGPCIPINADKNIISCTDSLILPGKLPKFNVGVKNNEVYVTSGQYEDYVINGKKFLLKDGAEGEIPLKYSAKGGQEKEYVIMGPIGNLLNIYLNYNDFLNVWNSSYTLSDYYASLLNIVNSNMYGLCKLEIGSYSGIPGGDKQLYIVDKKLRQKDIKSQGDGIYRFEIGPKASVVKSINFSLEMSNLMMAQALYQTNIETAKKEGGISGLESKTVPLKEEFSYTNLSDIPNIDGFKSKDWAQVLITNAQKKLNKADPNQNAPQTLDPKESEKALKNSKEVLQQKYTSFLNKETNEKLWNLIFKDERLVQSFMQRKIPNTSVLTPLECSVTLDGIAGFGCGELFRIDTVPEIYNKQGAFQITNVKQNIDDGGWTTTLEAMFRYDPIIEE